MAENKRHTRTAAQKAARASGSDESEVRAKIAALPDHYRSLGERLHILIQSAAPQLAPKTWYGMPAYAKDDKCICFFRGSKNERYVTLGFNPDAHLDDGRLWPIAFALTELTPAEEARIIELVKKAAA